MARRDCGISSTRNSCRRTRTPANTEQAEQQFKPERATARTACSMRDGGMKGCSFEIGSPKDGG
jgi:hypothetical protein